MTNKTRLGTLPAPGWALLWLHKHTWSSLHSGYCLCRVRWGCSTKHAEPQRQPGSVAHSIQAPEALGLLARPSCTCWHSQEGTLSCCVILHGTRPRGDGALRTREAAPEAICRSVTAEPVLSLLGGCPLPQHLRPGEEGHRPTPAEAPEHYLSHSTVFLSPL